MHSDLTSSPRYDVHREKLGRLASGKLTVYLQRLQDLKGPKSPKDQPALAHNLLTAEITRKTPRLPQPRKVLFGSSRLLVVESPTKALRLSSLVA